MSFLLTLQRVTPLVITTSIKIIGVFMKTNIFAILSVTMTLGFHSSLMAQTESSPLTKCAKKIIQHLAFNVDIEDRSERLQSHTIYFDGNNQNMTCNGFVSANIYRSGASYINLSFDDDFNPNERSNIVFGNKSKKVKTEVLACDFITENGVKILHVDLKDTRSNGRVSNSSYQFGVNTSDGQLSYLGVQDGTNEFNCAINEIEHDDRT